MTPATGFQKYIYWLADLLRPWHGSGLPSHLEFEPIKGEGYVRGSMLRAAHLCHSLQMEFEIFQILGLEHACRAAHAWRPRHLLLMEDLSRAFYPILQAVRSGEPLQTIRVDRYVAVMTRYLRYAGEIPTSEEIIRGLQLYVEKEHQQLANEQRIYGKNG